VSRRQAVIIGILFLSLVGEVLPLVLFWDSHLPVWQMSLMMFGAWVAAWWTLWVVVMEVWKLRLSE
jgi:hypothetical protein